MRKIINSHSFTPEEIATALCMVGDFSETMREKYPSSLQLDELLDRCAEFNADSGDYDEVIELEIRTPDGEALAVIRRLAT